MNHFENKWSINSYITQQFPFHPVRFQQCPSLCLHISLSLFPKYIIMIILPNVPTNPQFHRTLNKAFERVDGKLTLLFLKRKLVYDKTRTQFESHVGICTVTWMACRTAASQSFLTIQCFLLLCNSLSAFDCSAEFSLMFLCSSSQEGGWLEDGGESCKRGGICGGKRDRKAALWPNIPLTCLFSRWTKKGHGRHPLPNKCRKPLGICFFLLSWHLILPFNFN